MHEASPQENRIGLSESERNQILMAAELRRASQRLKLRLATLPEPAGAVQYQQQHQDSLDRIRQEADGVDEKDTVVPENWQEQAEAIIAEAEQIHAVAPNYIGYLCAYAEVAKMAQDAGEDFYPLLQKIRDDLTQIPDSPEPTLIQCLTDAIVIGIQKRALANAPQPPMEAIAQVASKDAELLKAYALILPEEEREEFISLLPPDLQSSASATMDHELSVVLASDIVSAEPEIEQHNAVLLRARTVLEGVVTMNEEASRSTVKALSETLAQLGDKDSPRILLQLGASGVPAGENEHQNHLKISYVARILETLINEDISKAGNLGMDFLAKKELPPRLFRFFCHRLIQKEYLTEALSRYLDDEQNLLVLRQLIAQYPNQFNTVLDTISAIPDYSLTEHQEEIFMAIRDLGSLTPRIFDRYRQADFSGRKELARQIHTLKADFFQNKPIKDVLPKKDRDILAEMVYLSYKPINMSFTKVEQLLGKLEDHTDDLEPYVFPSEGYEFTLDGQQVFTLRPGEVLDQVKLRTYRQLFSPPYPTGNEDKKAVGVLLNGIAKMNVNLKPEEIARVLSLLTTDDMITQFQDRYQTVNDQTSYGYLSELQELLSTYFNDHYPQRLMNFLDANPDITQRIQHVLANPNRLVLLQRNLSEEKDKVDWNSLSQASNIAEVLNMVIYKKIVSPIIKEIKKQRGKFVNEKGYVPLASSSNLKAYLSKNIGSFFAKASAGICTAEDIPLFERSEHFHINIVENDTAVRANIQAYIIDETSGSQSLVLRGFNPNSDFLEKIDPGSFCEAVLAVARQFQRDNNLEAVYITEQSGGWHALSNREQVADYMQKKYVSSNREKNYSLQVASSHTISKIYKVS